MRVDCYPIVLLLSQTVSCEPRGQSCVIFSRIFILSPHFLDDVNKDFFYVKETVYKHDKQRTKMCIEI